MNIITVSTNLATINCGECGGTYAIQERYRQRKHEEGGTWHCPYCQVGWGYVKGLNKELQEELEKTQVQLRQAKCDALNNASQRVAAENREQIAKRKLRRIKNGVCPCCKRSFENLKRHMQTCHKQVF